MQSQNLIENPTHIPDGINVPDVSDMPAEISYFFILTREQFQTKNGKKEIIPFVLTYIGDFTLQDIMEKYRSETGYAIPEAKSYLFSLSSTLRLKPNLTTKDLKKLMSRDSLDGIFLYVEYSTQPVDEDEYIDQCCVQDYFKAERKYGRKTDFWLRFQITLEGCPNTQVLYSEAKIQESGDALLERLIGLIEKQYGLKGLNLDRIQASFNAQIKRRNKVQNKVVNLNRGDKLSKQNLYNESVVKVVISNPKQETLVRINAPKYNSWIVIYKENESEPIRVKYDEVANLTVSDLYHSKLQLQASKKRRDAVYCLKIMDRILKPQEKLNSAEIYFKNSNSNKPLNVVAKVVNEKMIFYKAIPALASEKQTEFKLNQITIPPNQKQRREECQNIIRRRAEKAPHEYFKVVDNVGPIVIYTSQLKYLDQEAKQELVIYQSLNKYLRDTPILSLQESNFQKEWRLRYASTLLKHLDKTKSYEGETWRGISYDPNLSQKDVGAILTFKQFTSTSIYQKTAVGFAKQYGKEPYHLFAFKVKTGHSVIQYSLYGQGEILLQPYTEFELTNVSNTKLDGKRFNIYTLEERVTSKNLPGIMANFVVWIDDRGAKEGRAIFDKVQLPSETTVYEGLKSTAELQLWLNRHKQLFSDKSANLVFLTNMTRTQSTGKVNETAGIDGVKLIRQFTKSAPIFFYIGNVQVAKSKLQNANINLDKVYIGNQPKEAYSFLTNNIANSV